MTTQYLFKELHKLNGASDSAAAKIELARKVIRHQPPYPKSLQNYARSILEDFQQVVYSSSDAEASELHNFGMALLGPSMSVFFQRLAARTSLSEKPPTLYFLAREGYLLKRGFLDLRDELNAKADARYLIISRTLMFRVLLSNPISYPLIFTHSFKGSLRRFLVSRCGLLDEELNRLQLNEATFPGGLNSEVSLQNDENSLINLLQDNLDVIQTLTESTKDAYLDYLTSIGLFNEDEINLVDIGYSGTIQKALGILTGKKIIGHYMITTQSAESSDEHTFTGYLFNQQQWGQGCSLLEQSLYLEALLTSPTGSAKNIRKIANEYVFAYGPTTDSQEYFNILENIFEGAIKYCVSSSRHGFSLTPSEVNDLYSVVISNKSCFPELVKDIMVVEDNFSGLGNIKPIELYPN